MTERVYMKGNEALAYGALRVLNKEEKAKEFLKSLGKGKTIYECESENDEIDETEEENGD